MKRCAHSKAVLDDSLITVDTTSLHQHKLYYCTIALICYLAKVNSTSCVIQSPDQDFTERRGGLRLVHYLADVIPLFVYGIFPSNSTLR